MPALAGALNLSSMKKIHLNRKLFAIHSWLGLLLGIFFLLISISGAVSVFRFELNSLIYGNKMAIMSQKGKKTVSYDTIFSIAKKQFPNRAYYVVGFDSTYPGTPAFFSEDEDVAPQLFTPGMQYNVNYLSPYDGRTVLETSSNGKNNIIDWIMGFHYTFALGEGGELFIVLLDFALLASLITGVIFYRKHILKVLLFKERIRFANWRLVTSGLHRVIGTWALIFNILIFVSGLYIQKKFLVDKWWEKYTHVMNTTHHQVSMKIDYPLPGVSLDSLAKVALQKAPYMSLNEFSINPGGGGTISAFGSVKGSIFFAYGNFALVNFDRSGKYLSTEYTPWEKLSASEKFDNINLSLFHTGWALGIPGKILWCIMGFTPALLSLTGFLLWWRKRRSALRSRPKA